MKLFIWIQESRTALGKVNRLVSCTYVWAFFDDAVASETFSDPPLIGLDQALLGTLVAESQPVQPVQATAATQVEAEPLPYKPPHHPPPEPVEGTSWPVPGPMMTAAVAPLFSTPPAVSGRGRGGTAGLLEDQGRRPPSPKAEARPGLVEGPMVCGSRSSASATATAVQPWASNHMACQRSS